MIREGRPFYKMSGSGNDFVVVNALDEPPGELATVPRIRALCARGTGVGADGIVFVEPSTKATLRMTYYNSDGSLAAMCGNAALCTTRLAVELGAASPEGFTLETDSGVLAVRMHQGVPEIDLAPVFETVAELQLGLEQGEQRAGFALVGVPHVVIACDDVDDVDVVSRGRPLRRLAMFNEGANINFVSRSRENEWRIRTYERGVEAETLACGTGAAAAAILLSVWGAISDQVKLLTRSGRHLGVRLSRSAMTWQPSLSGEGVIVFSGALGEL